MPNPGLDPKKKEQVASMILAGASPNEIKEATGVSWPTISRIKASLPSEVIAKMKEEDVEMILDLVNQQLKSGIEATIVISEQVKDENWRKAQPANQLAIMYGVISDKSIRLLEAAEAAAIASAEEKSAANFDLTDEPAS